MRAERRQNATPQAVCCSPEPYSIPHLPAACKRRLSGCLLAVRTAAGIGVPGSPWLHPAPPVSQAQGDGGKADCGRRADGGAGGGRQGACAAVSRLPVSRPAPRGAGPGNHGGAHPVGGWGGASLVGRPAARSARPHPGSRQLGSTAPWPAVQGGAVRPVSAAAQSSCRRDRGCRRRPPPQPPTPTPPHTPGPQNFVISDPTLPDCPIVFASDPFLKLSGYRREEVLGRNWWAQGAEKGLGRVGARMPTARPAPASRSHALEPCRFHRGARLRTSAQPPAPLSAALSGPVVCPAPPHPAPLPAPSAPMQPLPAGPRHRPRLGAGAQGGHQGGARVHRAPAQLHQGGQALLEPADGGAHQVSAGRGRGGGPGGAAAAAAGRRACAQGKQRHASSTRHGAWGRCVRACPGDAPPADPAPVALATGRGGSWQQRPPDVFLLAAWHPGSPRRCTSALAACVLDCAPPTPCPGPALQGH